jgi:hypothetical protein
MHPFFIIMSIVMASVMALAFCFLGLSWLAKLFGQGRVERYIKLRTQGPFVPTPKNGKIGEDSATQ